MVQSTFSKHVATKIGRQFLNAIGKVFHSKHPLRKIFNRNTLCKIYSENKGKLANQMHAK